MRIDELLAGRQLDTGQMMRSLKHAADQAGLPLNDPKMVYNSRLAQELGEWAEASGKGDEFHRAAFMSYFVHGENIGDPAVLTALAESVKLPAKGAREVLASRSFREAVDAVWERARQSMITAVPTLIMGQGRLVGAQTYDVLKQFVMDNSNRR